MKKLINIFYYTCIALVAAIALVMLLTIFPVPGTDFDLRVVQSGSMEPAIRMGSLVLIRPTESPKINDIITYRRPNQQTPVTHRIIDIQVENDQTQYITKGDANEVRDMEPVTEEMIMGRVTLTVPLIGYGINFGRTPIGFALLIIVPAVLIGLDEIKKIIQVLRDRQPKSNI